MLPSSMTVAGIYKEYTESMSACQGELEIKSISSFRRVWRLHMPWLLISKPSSDLCWVCHANSSIYLRYIGWYLFTVFSDSR